MLGQRVACMLAVQGHIRTVPQALYGTVAEPSQRPAKNS
jgi:hypothetical protein